MNVILVILVVLSLLGAGCMTTRPEDEKYSQTLIERQEELPYEDDLTQGLEL